MRWMPPLLTLFTWALPGVVASYGWQDHNEALAAKYNLSVQDVISSVGAARRVYALSDHLSEEVSFLQKLEEELKRLSIEKGRTANDAVVHATDIAEPELWRQRRSRSAVSSVAEEDDHVHDHDQDSSSFAFVQQRLEQERVSADQVEAQEQRTRCEEVRLSDWEGNGIIYSRTNSIATCRQCKSAGCVWCPLTQSCVPEFEYSIGSAGKRRKSCPERPSVQGGSRPDQGLCLKPSKSCVDATCEERSEAFWMPDLRMHFGDDPDNSPAYSDVGACVRFAMGLQAEGGSDRSMDAWSCISVMLRDGFLKQLGSSLERVDYVRGRASSLFEVGVSRQSGREAGGIADDSEEAPQGELFGSSDLGTSFSELLREVDGTIAAPEDDGAGPREEAGATPTSEQRRRRARRRRRDSSSASAGAGALASGASGGSGLLSVDALGRFVRPRLARPGRGGGEGSSLIASASDRLRLHPRGQRRSQRRQRGSLLPSSSSELDQLDFDSAMGEPFVNEEDGEEGEEEEEEEEEEKEKEKEEGGHWRAAAISSLLERQEAEAPRSHPRRASGTFVPVICEVIRAQRSGHSEEPPCGVSSELSRELRQLRLKEFQPDQAGMDDVTHALLDSLMAGPLEPIDPIVRSGIGASRTTRIDWARTFDRRFRIKLSVSEKELSNFRSLAPELRTYFETNPSSLLARIYGAVSVTAPLYLHICPDCLTFGPRRKLFDSSAQLRIRAFLMSDPTYGLESQAMASFQQFQFEAQEEVEDLEAFEKVSRIPKASRRKNKLMSWWTKWSKKHKGAEVQGELFDPTVGGMVKADAEACTSLRSAIVRDARFLSKHGFVGPKFFVCTAASDAAASGPWCEEELGAPFCLKNDEAVYSTALYDYLSAVEDSKGLSKAFKSKDSFAEDQIDFVDAFAEMLCKLDSDENGTPVDEDEDEDKELSFEEGAMTNGKSKTWLKKLPTSYVIGGCIGGIILLILCGAGAFVFNSKEDEEGKKAKKSKSLTPLDGLDQTPPPWGEGWPPGQAFVAAAPTGPPAPMGAPWHAGLAAPMEYDPYAATPIPRPYFGGARGSDSDSTDLKNYLIPGGNEAVDESNTVGNSESNILVTPPTFASQGSGLVDQSNSIPPSGDRWSLSSAPGMPLPPVGSMQSADGSLVSPPPVQISMAPGEEARAAFAAGGAGAQNRITTISFASSPEMYAIPSNISGDPVRADSSFSARSVGSYIGNREVERAAGDPNFVGRLSSIGPDAQAQAAAAEAAAVGLENSWRSSDVDGPSPPGSGGASELSSSAAPPLAPLGGAAPFVGPDLAGGFEEYAASSAPSLPGGGAAASAAALKTAGDGGGGEGGESW